MATAITDNEIRNALKDVFDPELGDDIVSLGMVRNISFVDGVAKVQLALTIAACPLRSRLEADVEQRIIALRGVDSVVVEMGEMGPEERSAVMSRARWKARESAPPTRVPDRTKVLAIASGKGGVGKSSIAANLAAAIAASGMTVGVLDADIAGFSLPRMFSLDERLIATNGQIIPASISVGDGELRIVSMGLINGSGEDEAIMLRGLMLNRALQHFLEDVQWGDLDYLIIDMPPGTSDVQMGLARMLPRAEMIVVTTPAVGAQQVATRAVDMARRSHVRVAGIIENMSAFVGKDGEHYALFGQGGGRRLSGSTGVPLLAEIPLDPSVSGAGDLGRLVVLQSTSPIKDIFTDLATRVVRDIAPLVDMDNCTNRLLAAVEAALDEASPAS